MILFDCFGDAIFRYLLFGSISGKIIFLEFTSKHKVWHIFATLHWIILQKMKQVSTKWFYQKCSRKEEVYFYSVSGKKKIIWNLLWSKYIYIYIYMHTHMYAATYYLIYFENILSFDFSYSLSNYLSRIFRKQRQSHLKISSACHHLKGRSRSKIFLPL